MIEFLQLTITHFAIRDFPEVESLGSIHSRISSSMNLGKTKCGHVTIKYSSSIQMARRANSKAKREVNTMYSRSRPSFNVTFRYETGQAVLLSGENTIKRMLRAKITSNSSQYLGRLQ